MFKENIFGSELIWGLNKFMFPNKKGKSNLSQLFIFSMVKRDAIKYLATRKMRKTKWQSSVVYNKQISVVGRRLIGTDIDSAYWHLAHHMKIISDNTFEKGLTISEKRILVASLSSLGRDKSYKQIVDGRLTEDMIIIKGRDDLKDVYKKIRYTCFKYMKQLADLLGEDFVAYKTDCIYYLHTHENIKKVKDFLDNKKLDYKMVSDYGHFTDYIED